MFRSVLAIVLAIVMAVLPGCITTMEDVRAFRPSKTATFQGDALSIARCTMQRLNDDPDPLRLRYSLQNLADTKQVSLSGDFHDIIPLFGEGISFEALFMQRDHQTVLATFRDSDAKRLGTAARERIWPFIEWCAKPG